MWKINDGLYIGTDGCKNGWITCILDHGELRMEHHDSIEALINSYPEFDAFLIDMAVGLRTSADQLRPDDLARKELGTRSATVFPIPCRQAVYAATEEEQKNANIHVFGKSLAKQSIAIIPKIRELDEFLSSHPQYKNRILESHPELAFARLKGSVVLTRKKEYSGFCERENILQKYLPRGCTQISRSDLRRIQIRSVRRTRWKVIIPKKQRSHFRSRRSGQASFTRVI